MLAREAARKLDPGTGVTLESKDERRCVVRERCSLERAQLEASGRRCRALQVPLAALELLDLDVMALSELSELSSARLGEVECVARAWMEICV